MAKTKSTIKSESDIRTMLAFNEATRDKFKAEGKDTVVYDVSITVLRWVLSEPLAKVA